MSADGVCGPIALLDGFSDSTRRQGIEGHRGISDRKPPDARETVEPLGPRATDDRISEPAVLRNATPNVTRTLDLLFPPERKTRLCAAGEKIGIRDEHAHASPGAQGREIPPPCFGGFDQDASTALVGVYPVATHGNDGNLPVLATHERSMSAGKRGRSPGRVNDEPRLQYVSLFREPSPRPPNDSSSNRHGPGAPAQESPLRPHDISRRATRRKEGATD